MYVVPEVAAATGFPSAVGGRTRTADEAEASSVEVPRANVVSERTDDRTEARDARCSKGEVFLMNLLPSERARLRRATEAAQKVLVDERVVVLDHVERAGGDVDRVVANALEVTNGEEESVHLAEQ